MSAIEPKPNLILVGIDLETTGLVIDELSITEVSAVLWDSLSSSPIRMFTSLIKLPSGVRIPEEIIELNGITDEACAKWGRDLATVLGEIGADFFHHSSAVVAHNGTDFEKPILKRFMPAISIPSLWIDTSLDVPYPNRISTRKLTHLCAEHGFLNPFPHRSLFDVVSMMKILDQYPLSAVLELARSETMRIQADVSYDDREKAKARGYRWVTEQKIWARNIKACHLERERAEAGFPVIILQGGP